MTDYGKRHVELKSMSKAKLVGMLEAMAGAPLPPPINRTKASLVETVELIEAHKYDLDGNLKTI